MQIFVWHVITGELLASLEGHSGTVNAVAWNPKRTHLLASASDEGTVHIWKTDPSAYHIPRKPSKAYCSPETPLPPYVYGQSLFSGRYQHSSIIRHNREQLNLQQDFE